MFNWRASNELPLCQWEPPRDGLSRQLLGYGLPFCSRSSGCRERVMPVASVESVLRHIDVVGLTARRTTFSSCLRGRHRV